MDRSRERAAGQPTSNTIPSTPACPSMARHLPGRARGERGRGKSRAAKEEEEEEEEEEGKSHE